MKNKKIKYYLIFPALKNVHLVKDVGMIPFVLYKYYGYESYIVNYNNDDYPYLNNEVKGLEMYFLRKHQFKCGTNPYKIKFDIMKFLIMKSKTIDVLQLIHISKPSYLYALIYKLLNKKGVLYLKTDFDTDRNFLSSKYKTGMKGRIKYIIHKFLLNYLFDIISVETKKDFAKLNTLIRSDKLLYLPSGPYIPRKENCDFTNKENYILTVSRLGTRQKATDVLLEAFGKIKDLKNWKLILIGTIEESFKQYIDEYFKRYPHLKERVIFTGNISDRKFLYEYYLKAKIFTLPSRWENFSIALIEAAYFGCYIVATDVGVAREILEITNYGTLVEKDEIESLANAFQELILNWNNYERNPVEINEIIEENFSWVKICGELDNKIKRIIKEKKL